MTTEQSAIIKVALANISAILINMADLRGWINLEVIVPNINYGDIIQNALSIVSLIIAICYTIWKWSNDIKKKKANIKKYYQEKDESKD
jgi:hypothetical protein